VKINLPFLAAKVGASSGTSSLSMLPNY